MVGLAFARPSISSGVLRGCRRQHRPVVLSQSCGDWRGVASVVTRRAVASLRVGAVTKPRVPDGDRCVLVGLLYSHRVVFSYCQSRVPGEGYAAGWCGYHSPWQNMHPQPYAASTIAEAATKSLAKIP